MNPKRTILSAEHIRKHYGEAEVLNDISLEIYAGDFTVIMGSSGSGKSTLLSCLGGMEQPSQGKVFCGETEISGASERVLEKLRADHLGFVFQKTHLVSNLTLYENIVMAGLISSQMKEANVRECAEELLAQMNLKEAKDRLPAAVSGGEAQRAAVARAVMGNPDLLLCDEPTGALNKANTREVLNLFTHLNTNGQTILLVTHDREAALRGNRILYLEDGSIISEQILGEYRENDGAREQKLSTWLEGLGW